MLILQAAIVFNLMILGWTSQNAYVIAPCVLKFNYSEDVLVGVFNELTNQPFSVWLVNSMGKTFSNTTGIVLDADTPTKTTVLLTEADLYDKVSSVKPRKIRICATVGNISIPCKMLRIDYRTGYLILQTDKPVYTPRQEVKLRAAAVDENMHPMINKNVSLRFDVISPGTPTMTFGRKIVQTDDPSGFYWHTFDLPPNPALGIWTARVQLLGQYETEERATFRVMEYVLPTFEVSVYPSSNVILESTTTIDITIVARYVYGEPVVGRANIFFNITDEMGVSKRLQFVQKSTLEKGRCDFTVNIMELLHTEQPFPVNSRLGIEAFVLESTSGRKERAYVDNLLLAEHFYKFSFQRSRKTFHRNHEYQVKIDLTDANDVPVTSPIEVTINRLDDYGNIIESKGPNKPSNDGSIVAIFAATNDQTMTFQASLMNGTKRVDSETHTVYAYEGKNIIQLSTAKKGTSMILNVKTNVQSKTRVLIMAISRGRIVKYYVKNVSNSSKDKTQVIDDTVKNDLSPRGRLVALYISDNHIVADAMQIDLTAKCKGKGLTLLPDRTRYKPGDRMTLNVRGDPNMAIGLGGIDRALLALDREHVFKTDTVFQKQRSRDRGCGQGGGLNSGQVLQNACVSVLTEATVDGSDTSEPILPECDGSKRRKRDTSYCDEYMHCCDYGVSYAQNVTYVLDEDEITMKNPDTICYNEAYRMASSDMFSTLPIGCIVAIYRTCLEEIELFISDDISISGRTLMGQSDYEADLKRIGKTLETISRSVFDESILFSNEPRYLLDESGTTEVHYPLPDSITTWSLQAIGISKTGTICIADPTTVVVMKDIFIQLDLPYRAKRMELFEIKATFFNYKTKSFQMNVYMKADYGICYADRADNPSRMMTIELDSNSAKTVTFLAKPIGSPGLYDVTMIAVGTGDDITSDVIRKQLHVENEGVKVSKTFQVCIGNSLECEDSTDKITTNKDTPTEVDKVVDLSLPSEAIEGTAEATGYIKGHIMAAVVTDFLENTDSLFGDTPTGCAEQTISRTVPNVFALLYLKATEKMTLKAETKGIDNIRKGINREKTLHKDSATASYGYGSVWLTSYVLKVYCHAERVVENIIDKQEDLHDTTMWLINRDLNSYNIYMKTYLLITLMECDNFKHEIQNTVDDIYRYLSGLDPKTLSPENLAMVTYALALVDPKNQTSFRDTLISAKIKPITDMTGRLRWNGEDHSSSEILTASYTLLALMLYDDLDNSAVIVRWLTSQQAASGKLGDTQSTAIALQALSKYAITTKTPTTDIKIKLLAHEWQSKHEYRVTNENSNAVTIVNKLPVRVARYFTLIAEISGGSARMTVDLVYYRHIKPDEKCAFNISPIKTSNIKYDDDVDTLLQNRKCDVCGENCELDPSINNVNYSALSTTEATPEVRSNIGRKKRSERNYRKNCVRFSVSSINQESHGMAMVKFDLQTGVAVVKKDLDKLMENNRNIFLYETPDSLEGHIVFYLYTLNSTRNDFVFRVEDTYERRVASLRQPALVNVYDYYNDEVNCKLMYGIDENSDVTFWTEKDFSNQQWTCERIMCAKDVRGEIEQFWSTGTESVREKWATMTARLLKYACDENKANYAFVVKITEISTDVTAKEHTAIGTVLNVYQKGIDGEMKKGKTMTFYWPLVCHLPDLKVNGKYLIIGQDGYMVKINNESSVRRYPLSETALVIEKRQDKTDSTKRLNKLLNHFGKELREKGCRT